MSLANFLTSLRIFLSPFFLAVFFLPVWTDGEFKFASVITCWIIFIVMELSDLFDGMAARAAGVESDLGKLFDPFADVVSRLTYFLCFVGIGIMPLWVFAIIMYRELGIIFMRLLAVRKGFAMGARMGGKLKAWTYAFGGISGLIYVSVERSGIFSDFLPQIKTTAEICFYLAAGAALISLVDYIMLLYKKYRVN